MADNISQIKERLNVVDVISGYIKVQKAGANFKARCPFHNEKTPSFYISPERQIWHCFGCQKGGDIFGFVKEVEGIEFGEALRILAQKAGVKLENFDPALRDAKTVLQDICETSAKFFEKQLHHSTAGKKALAYLKDRGLNESMVKEFRLGFAPDGWHSLGNFLRDCGFKDKDIIDAGMALKREDGSDIYDRFRSRIIFPIADLNDQIVGFTGRVFETAPNTSKIEPAKYINSPQTLIYDKSRVLYGLNKAKMEIRKSDSCLLVEGNMDVIMSYQAGVKNVAATSGTALTPSHLQLLQRYTNNLDFCFDTDQAGLVATRRGIGLALSRNLNVKIVNLDDKECKDPADYVKKFNIKWQEVVRASKPVVEFYFEKLRSELNLESVEGKKAMIAMISPLVKRLASQIEKSHWISRLSAVLKTKEEDVKADIASAKDDLEAYETYNSAVAPSKQSKAVSLPEDILNQALLAVILKNPALFEKEIGSLAKGLIDPQAAAVIAQLEEESLDKFDFNSFIKKFDQETAMKIEFIRLKSEELFKDFSDQDLQSEFNNLKKKIEHKKLSVQLASLELDIKDAELSRDKAKLSSLLPKFSELVQKLNLIQNNAQKETNQKA